MWNVGNEVILATKFSGNWNPDLSSTEFNHGSNEVFQFGNS